jgi:HSP20 family molecular chaperone IbpA
MSLIEAENPTNAATVLKCDTNGYLYVNTEGESSTGTEGEGAPSTGGQQMLEARTSDKTAVDNGDSVRAVADVYGFADNATRIKEVNPEAEQYTSSTPVDVTNEADDTYYEYIDMAGYRHLSLQLEVTAGSGSVTVTLEGTTQDDGTAPASCTYQDIGSTIFGAATWTADAWLVDDTGITAGFRFIRIKRTHDTSGADDSGLTVYAKRWA